MNTPNSGTFLTDCKDVTNMSDKERSDMRNGMLGFCLPVSSPVPGLYGSGKCTNAS